MGFGRSRILHRWELPSVRAVQAGQISPNSLNLPHSVLLWSGEADSMITASLVVGSRTLLVSTRDPSYPVGSVVER
jgi:hypothetical protein